MGKIKLYLYHTIKKYMKNLSIVGVFKTEQIAKNYINSQNKSMIEGNNTTFVIDLVDGIGYVVKAKKSYSLEFQKELDNLFN